MLQAATENVYYCPFVVSFHHLLWSDIQGVNQCFLDVTIKHWLSVILYVCQRKRNRSSHQSWLYLFPLSCVMALHGSLALAGAMTAVVSPWAEQRSGCIVHSHGAVQCMDCVLLSVVRCQPCHCRRGWRETCSSVCKLWRVSSDHIWVTERNERSSESKRSEMTKYRRYQQPQIVETVSLNCDK